MIDVSGILIVTNDEVRIVEREKGAFFNFWFASEDQKPPHVKHYYNTSLWIPTDEIKRWKTLIVKGKVFRLKHGEWHAERKEGQKYPISVLKMHRSNLVPMGKPYWLEKE